MHWTSQPVELDVEVNSKACSRCGEFKSLTEFYRQGERYESLCKGCKQKNRSERQTKNAGGAPQPVKSAASQTVPASGNPKGSRTYKNLGFSQETFLELVDFYRELIRLDEQRRTK